MKRRRPLFGVSIAIIGVAAALIASAGTRGGNVCAFDGDLPFEGMTLTAVEQKSDYLTESAARERSALISPGVAAKAAQLSLIKDPIVPSADGRVAWVLLREQPIEPQHDAQGNPIDTVHVCGVTLLDAATGELIFYADVGIEK